MLYKYRKVNPWIPYEVHASPHDLPGYDEPLFPVADTRDRRASAAPSATTGCSPRRSASSPPNGAEVLIRVSAYMDPWGATEPMDWWTVVNRCRALENMAYVVAANQGASLRALPAVLVAGRQHGRGLRRPHAGPGLARAGRADRRGARRHHGAAPRAGDARRATTCSPTCAPRRTPSTAGRRYPPRARGRRGRRRALLRAQRLRYRGEQAQIWPPAEWPGSSLPRNRTGSHGVACSRRTKFAKQGGVQP